MGQYQGQTPFTKSLFTAVFVGIICTLVCLFFDVFYREETRFGLSAIINVASIIFAINLLFVVIGVIHYFFTRISHKGTLFFIVVFALLTVLGAFESETVNRSADHLQTLQFRNLLLGIVLITGVCASFLLPYLFSNKKFEENVL